jgi:polyisoprenoid-binding protein YceI
MRKTLLALPLALMLAACLSSARQELTDVGPGEYHLKKDHASLVWRVMHLGLSHYTGRLTDLDMALDFNPQDPVASHVRAVINPLSVSAEHPTDTDWNRRIGEDFMRGKEFPQIVFESTRIEKTGEFTGKVTGDLTFMGVTRPVTLDVTYNGHGLSPFDPGKDLVGFSARGVIHRLDYGLTNYSSIASDEVEIIIEAEFVHE